MIIALGGGFTATKMAGSSGSDSAFNTMSNLTSVATTTGSYFNVAPVKLLSMDASRRYAVISNPSDTAIYVYITNDNWGINSSGDVNATSTITFPLSGIYIAAGGRYELATENMVYGNIWASSTAINKQINVSYK